MVRYDVCGNEYDKTMEIRPQGKNGTLDSFEAAIQALAPTCAQCGCRIISHGVEHRGIRCRGSRAGLPGGLAARLRALTRAEEKIRNGSYGRCGVCGQPIPAARLNVMPEAVRCVPCAERETSQP